MRIVCCSSMQGASQLPPLPSLMKRTFTGITPHCLRMEKDVMHVSRNDPGWCGGPFAWINRRHKPAFVIELLPNWSHCKLRNSSRGSTLQGPHSDWRTSVSLIYQPSLLMYQP